MSLVSFEPLIRGQRRERAPEQDGNDQEKYDDVAIGARPKGGEGFDRADQQRADSSEWIDGHAADNGADKSFQPKDESGVVIEGRCRADQQARDGSGKARDKEHGSARRNRADADDFRPPSIVGGRQKRAATQ